MLDVKFIRDNLESVHDRLASRGEQIDLKAALFGRVGQPLAEGYGVTLTVTSVGAFVGRDPRIALLTDEFGEVATWVAAAEAGTATISASTENGVSDTVEVQFYEPVRIESLDTNSPVLVGEALTLSTQVSGTGPFTYSWDFGGDPVVAAAEAGAPTAVYEEEGIYTVSLTVESPFDSDMIGRQVFIALQQVFLPSTMSSTRR